MINGNITKLDSRLTKLENYTLMLRTNLVRYQTPTIIAHEGDDVDRIVREMEARGEIPSAADFPGGHVRAIVHRIVKPTRRAV